MDELWQTFILSKPCCYFSFSLLLFFYYANGFKSQSPEKYRLLETALWFLFFYNFPYKTVGNTVSLQRLLLLHISLRIHFINHSRSFVTMLPKDWKQRKKMPSSNVRKKIIIFIIKSVLLHEQTIKWPINFFSFSCPLNIFSADIRCALGKSFLTLSIGKWKIYDRD